MKTEISDSHEHHGTRAAFTFTDLLATVGIVVLLSMMLIPALAGSRTDGFAFRCMNNLRQMQVGWLAYSTDNSGNICPIASAANLGAPNWCGTSRMDVIGLDAGSGGITAIQTGVLWPYIKSLPAFKCPADPKLSSGYSHMPTLRSISMNAWMNPVSSPFPGLSGPGRK